MPAPLRATTESFEIFRHPWYFRIVCISAARTDRIPSHLHLARTLFRRVNHLCHSAIDTASRTAVVT